MAVAIVQDIFNEAGGGATTIASGSFVSNVTSGNVLYVVTVFGLDTAGTTASISKNSGTATIGTPVALEATESTGIADRAEQYAIPITGTGSLDLLATFTNSSGARQIWAFELSGAAMPELDDSDANWDVNSDPTPNLTVSVDTQPALGIMLGVDQQDVGLQVGSGWTDQGTEGATQRVIRLQTKTISATGNTSGNFENNNLVRNITLMVIFEESTTTGISLAWIRA